VDSYYILSYYSNQVMGSFDITFKNVLFSAFSLKINT